ncbi:phytanoyl-CoA dioxygenase family protein [Streptomyces syringium]|uniref:phytanoyl-CoA dioxygenase family protein n=1 Tax=Streptomyces syringium TaxID=76729 RepID=UPI003452F1AE
MNERPDRTCAPGGPQAPRPAPVHTVTPAGHGIPVSLRHVLRGALVAVEGGLRRAGALEEIRCETGRAVARTLPGPAAARVGDSLERLHLHADTEQITAIRTDLETRLRPLAEAVLRDVALALEPQGARLYLGGHLGIRVMPPQRSLAGGAPSGLEGFLTPRDAHVDSWFNTAVNSVNLWMAVGPVRRGNGLVFYPDAYHRRPRHDGRHTLVPGQHTGPPMDIELAAGDILFFAGDHLHASQPNTTDETRFVITKRLCLGPPRYARHATGWVPYEDPRLLGGPLEPLAALRSRLTAGGVRDLLRAWPRRGLPRRSGRSGPAAAGRAR